MLPCQQICWYVVTFNAIKFILKLALYVCLLVYNQCCCHEVSVWNVEIQNIEMEENASIMWSKTWKTTKFQKTGMVTLGRLNHRKICAKANEIRFQQFTLIKVVLHAKT